MGRREKTGYLGLKAPGSWFSVLHFVWLPLWSATFSLIPLPIMSGGPRRMLAYRFWVSVHSHSWPSLLLAQEFWQWLLAFPGWPLPSLCSLRPVETQALPLIPKGQPSPGSRFLYRFFGGEGVQKLQCGKEQIWILPVLLPLESRGHGPPWEAGTDPLSLDGPTWHLFLSIRTCF